MTINAIVVLAYLLGTIGFGVYLKKFVKKDEDFFLAGRSLNKWVIAGMIMATKALLIPLVMAARISNHSNPTIFETTAVKNKAATSNTCKSVSRTKIPVIKIATIPMKTPKSVMNEGCLLTSTILCLPWSATPISTAAPADPCL